MVEIKLNYKNYGVYEWIIVRLSAIFISIYFVYVFSFIIFSNNLSYEQWYSFFNNKITKIFNVITLLCILVHTWIGVRHILEDYIKSIKLRKLGVGLTYTILYLYLLFGIVNIWGI